MKPFFYQMFTLLHCTTINNNCYCYYFKPKSVRYKFTVMPGKNNWSIPENDTTWILCLWTPLSCPGFVFTRILSFPLILSGPNSAKTPLQFLRLPHSWANMPNELNSCSVFLSSQCKAHKLTSHNLFKKKEQIIPYPSPSEIMSK